MFEFVQQFIGGGVDCCAAAALTFCKHSSTCCAISSGVRCNRLWQTGHDWHCAFRMCSVKSDSESPLRFRVLARNRPCRLVRMRWNVCEMGTWDKLKHTIVRMVNECNSLPPNDCPGSASDRCLDECPALNWNCYGFVGVQGPSSAYTIDPIRRENVSPIRWPTNVCHTRDTNSVAAFLCSLSFSELKMNQEFRMKILLRNHHEHYDKYHFHMFEFIEWYIRARLQSVNIDR